MNYSKAIADRLYAAMSVCELESYRTSVSVSDLRKLGGKTTVATVLKGIDELNEETERENLMLLVTAFQSAWAKLAVMPIEKYLFLRVLARVKKGTDNFRITYQSEPTTETIGNSESGLTPYRKTTVTAAGLRTCFNSLEYLDNEVPRLARKQENEKRLQKASEQLAASLGIDAKLLTPELLAKFGFTRVLKQD